MTTARLALDDLDFGSVNSEEENDLDRLFVQTTDFHDFLKPKTWVVLGAKGTGKSALFEFFISYEEAARRASGAALDDVILGAATGFNDLSEISTEDFESLKTSASGYNHATLWRLYIAIKAGLGIPSTVNVGNGPLREIRRAVGVQSDYRIGPLLSDLWQLAVGRAPEVVTIASHGATVSIKGGKSRLDVTTILSEINTALENAGKSYWLLFDKIDEIWPQNREERKRALEGLMSAAMDIRKKFPRINPVIFMRTDLWWDLDFTNKDHILGKTIVLNWSTNNMASLLVKRAVQSDAVRAYIEGADPGLAGREVDQWSPDEVLFSLKKIFPETPYSGINEASIDRWIVDRVTDGKDTALPRDAIILSNFATTEQRSSQAVAEGSLISRTAIREAYTRTSQAKVTHFLSEFPDLKNHFRRFANQTTASFSRSELLALMDGLSPSGEDLLEQLHEIGLVRPDREPLVNATQFEIPRLYRKGLGLVISGRP